MKTIFIILLALVSSCDFIEVTSTKEPKTEREALNLAGIIYDQEIEFIDFTYSPGFQDDGMEIVFDIPKENIKWFWYHSPFYEEEKIEYSVDNKDNIKFPIYGNGKLWKEAENATSGLYSVARVNGNDYSKIFVTQKGKIYRCYLKWIEM
ncbi:hypothetical protein LNTAR_19362 [Lentisphaera araneosa HTCC2155]|uniref:Uncharacterized protein n=1 Tax=Lentisphaera araneosa HTCC2155 TaxID=313628 RepID=A6DQT8_9BACT|nr:hypothetical protein [Lentisphaera araneosa]EDM25988.1 hypothetical protein LNTAR_19362 [Lentisphaera araneosa HTCC2155]